MDPTAALQQIIAAIKDRDRDEMLSAISDLKIWYCHGGFMPKIEWDDLEFLIDTIADHARL